MSEEEAFEVEPEPEHHTVPQALFNPTLGAAANGVFLDAMEEQLMENRRAEIENRPARIAKREERHPNYRPAEVTSLYSDISFGTHYEDGEKVIAPPGGNVTPASGLIAAAHKGLQKAQNSPSRRPAASSAPAPQVGGSTPQKGTEAPSRPSGGKE